MLYLPHWTPKCQILELGSKLTESMFTEAGFDDCFVDQTWSAAKSHMKMMMLSCFPTAKKCVPVSRGRWPKGNRQAIDSFQMLLVKTWWFHDYLILHVLLYIYVHVYIHTCTYVCMYVYIYIHMIFGFMYWGTKCPITKKRTATPSLCCN